MKTIGDAWWVLCCCFYSASWVKFDYLRWEALLLVGLLPALFLWWKGGAFKRAEK